MRTILAVLAIGMFSSAYAAPALANRGPTYQPSWQPVVAQAHHRAHHHIRHARVHRHRAHVRVTNRPTGPALRLGLVTVQTAAHISITVAANLAAKFQGFISDLVNVIGYRPRHIGCFAATGHVPGSRHHVGAACDIDQSGWDRTARAMYSPQVTALAHKWGLRSGCEFRGRRDCGHIDDGRPLIRIAARHRRHA